MKKEKIIAYKVVHKETRYLRGELEWDGYYTRAGSYIKEK